MMENSNTLLTRQIKQLDADIEFAYNLQKKYYTLDQARALIKREEKHRALRKAKRRKAMRKALLKKALRIIMGILFLITGAIVFPQLLTQSTELLAVFETLSWIIVAMIETAIMFGLMGVGMYLLFE